jgi:hypothetical protein
MKKSSGDLEKIGFGKNLEKFGKNGNLQKETFRDPPLVFSVLPGGKSACEFHVFSVNFLHAEKDEKAPYQHFEF